MTTIDIDDRYTDEVLELLERSLPKEAFRVKPDPLREELRKRLDEIDSGEMEMIPFREGMDNLKEKLKSKYEHRVN